MVDDDPANRDVLSRRLEGNRWWGDLDDLTDIPPEEPTFVQLLDLLRHAQQHFIAPAYQQDKTQAPYDIYWHLVGALEDPGLGQQQFVDRFEHFATLYGVEK